MAKTYETTTARTSVLESGAFFLLDDSARILRCKEDSATSENKKNKK